MSYKQSIVLEDGLDLNQLVTTGSVLKINTDYDETETSQPEKEPAQPVDFIGKPVKSFAELEKEMVVIDDHGWVKKTILEEGGGMPLDEGCTVHIAFSGYWENEKIPFDTRRPDKPMIVDLNDNGLLPGLQMAVKTMLVGEMSVFLFSYEVMYGKLGIPPRIKPEANCVFYIKLVKSIMTPKEDKAINLSEPNMFQKVYHEVNLQLCSGVSLHKSKNDKAAIALFRRAVYLLHGCRLADENEEVMQEKMLKKLYLNLAVCYNCTKQPLKTCVACNELNRLNSLWNNPKALFQNAKALRMIGQFDAAEKRLLRAKRLSDSIEIDNELDLLAKVRNAIDKSNLMFKKTVGTSDLLSEDFKREVDDLIKNFKQNLDLCMLTLPENLNSAEVGYIKEACVKDNLFFNKVSKNFALDRENRALSSGEGDKTELFPEEFADMPD